MSESRREIDQHMPVISSKLDTLTDTVRLLAEKVDDQNKAVHKLDKELVSRAAIIDNHEKRIQVNADDIRAARRSVMKAAWGILISFGTAATAGAMSFFKGSN